MKRNDVKIIGPKHQKALLKQDLNNYFKLLGEKYFYHLHIESWEDEALFIDDRDIIMNDIIKTLKELRLE